MDNSSHGLVADLMQLPIFQAEWVLYLLISLSVLSVSIMIERLWFYSRHSVDIHSIRTTFNQHLLKGDFESAASYLQKFDSLETNTTLFGLRAYAQGPEAVQDLLAGAARIEKSRYEKRLNFLATVASNAPFIGLFGTVLGIIRAFKDLSSNIGEAGGAVMGGIAEALIATAIGLLVAIPAVIAFNIFKAKVKSTADNGNLLVVTLLARLKSTDAEEL